MGLLNLFKKKKVDNDDQCNVLKEQQKTKNESLDKAEKIYNKLKKYSEVKVVRFELKEEHTDILDSKIGGAYYVPKDSMPPINKQTNEPMYLLAQLNFAQIPHLENFPEKGLLQIFISSEDLYGCDFDNPYQQEKWNIRYYEHLPEVIDEKNIYKPKWTEDTELPLMKDITYRLEPIIDVQTISIYDRHFDLIASKCLEQELQSALEDDEVRYALTDHTLSFSCQMGGYPFFTQEDPRNIDEAKVLLFQLDTVKDIMWGDSGVGNFFISEDDLKNRDFSHVMYNWDCF